MIRNFWTTLGLLVAIVLILVVAFGCNGQTPTAPPDAVLGTATTQGAAPRFVCNNADNPPPWCDDDNWTTDNPPGQGGTPPGQQP